MASCSSFFDPMTFLFFFFFSDDFLFGDFLFSDFLFSGDEGLSISAWVVHVVFVRLGSMLGYKDDYD